MLNIQRAVSDGLRPGMNVYLPGATGESLALAAALAADPEPATGVHFFGCFVPGMNAVDYAGLNAGTRLTTFMLPSEMRPSFLSGQVEVIPATYLAAAVILANMQFDTAFAHVSLPDAQGRCSLGIASDFAPLVWTRARRRVLLVNPQMPFMRRAPVLLMRDADMVIDANGPLIEAPESAGGPIVDNIARRIAAIVPDHATIQTGIGAVPTAVWKELQSHKGLILRSGFVPDGFRALAEAGALGDPTLHSAGIAFGSAALYGFLAESDLVAFRATNKTHALAGLAQCPGFHAINSALEVDLGGRANVAWQQGRLAGGVGGLPDFARAASIAPGGRSIIALPATAKQGRVSRIVPVLEPGTAGLGAEAVDMVVTEHGVADLRGLSIDRRAEALIAISAPTAREKLAAAWSAMRTAF